jgi:ABC-type lipoprotein release transport system permease subunit
MIYAASVLVMLLVALLASALPAMRAASADPIQALRSI